MPVDSASGSVIVQAPSETVLAVLRDVAAQLDWVAEITEAELLEEYEDGTPATARFEMSTRLGVDHYTLEYTNEDDSLSWVMVEGQMQKAQNGSYRLRNLSDGRTEVTLSLEVEHSIAAPGFIRRKIFQAVVETNLAALKAYVEA